MVPIPFEALGAEIERIRRRYLSLLASAREAACTWELQDQALRWYVILGDVDEPDVDIEVREDVIIVRARAAEAMRHSVLPIPSPCRARRPAFRIRADILEVRLEVRET